MSISKIKEINKKFDEEFSIHKGRKWILTEEEAKDIKVFYTQQILSLIEELEGKLIKTIQDKYDKEKNTKPFIHKMLFQTAREARERHQGFLSGLLVSIDQMRASIKSFINESGVKS